ncbi:hypothetical protein ACFX2C_005969 [Malus domestica]
MFLRKSSQSKCTVGQLRCVEKSTIGRDLSPVTDMLWRNFYVKEFGASRLKSRHQMEASRKQCRQVFVGTGAEVPSLSRTNKSSSSSNTLGVGSDNVSVRKKESLIMKKAKSYCSKKDSTTFKRSAIVSEDYAPKF